MHCKITMINCTVLNSNYFIQHTIVLFTFSTTVVQFSFDYSHCFSFFSRVKIQELVQEKMVVGVYPEVKPQALI